MTGAHDNPVWYALTDRARNHAYPVNAQRSWMLMRIGYAGPPYVGCAYGMAIQRDSGDIDYGGRAESVWLCA